MTRKRRLVIALVVLVAAAGTAAGILFGTRGSESTPSPTVAVDPSPPPPSLTSGWSTDFGKHSVSFDEIQSGGPPKDGIPAIDTPAFTRVGETDFLEPPEPVIALEVDGDVRAYPIQILIWHEIVNDEVGGRPVTVTFCPLCNTAIVFDRRLDGRVLDFGTTGNLRNSDLVMYDRQTESWWQQFSGEAIVGELTGEKLTQLSARIVSWQTFARAYPDGKVLSRDTGYERSYGTNPYSGYDDAATPPFFPTENADDARLAPKERVVYIEGERDSVAVPYSALRDRREIAVTLEGRELVVRWEPGVASALGAASIAGGADIGSALVLENGRAVPFHEPFWFAVAAFRPETKIVGAGSPP